MERLKRLALLFAAIAVLGLVAMIAGIAAGGGGEAGLATAGIAFGPLVFIFAGLFAFMVDRIRRRGEAVARGEGVIASWQVSPSALAAFRANEAARKTDATNLYRPAAKDAERWIDVAFAADGVLIDGRYYFGLVSSGLMRVIAVRMVPERPVCIEFSLLMTGLSYGGVALSAPRHNSVLRIPGDVAAQGQMARVLAHYQSVLGGRRLVKGDYWPRLVRWSFGASAAGVAFALAVHFLFGADGLSREADDLRFILIALGVGTGIGGLVTAAFFAGFARQQRGGGASR